MWITKSINNSCAFGRDSQGNDVIVFGKGLGYRRPPYELDDLSRIERTFYGVKPAVANMLADIPGEYVLVASDIATLARAELGVELNPNFPVTLADHLNFAIARHAKGLDLETPLAHDVRHLFPKETRLATLAVGLVNQRLGADLPEEEVANVALHLIDAESDQGDMNATRKATTVISDVTKIVERDPGTTIDTDSTEYARFAMHLRYLAARVDAGREQGRDRGTDVAPMLEVMRGSYPEAWRVAQDVLSYFSDTWGWECDESETLYLLIHLQRLRTALE